MTENDQVADLIRMTRYYLDRSYYPDPGRAEYYAAFTLACGFLGLSPAAGVAQEAWARILERHLGGGEGAKGNG
jgi:hypothetical protein